MAKNNGNPCDKGASVEVEPCNSFPCGRVEYCGWAEWADWSDCSVSCGDGEMSRMRVLEISIVQPEELLDSGVLADMHSQLLELQGRFSMEHLCIVFIFGALTSALLVTSMFMLMRRRGRGTNAGLISMARSELDDDSNLLERELLHMPEREME